MKKMAAELITIILGVLIALGVDDWRQGREEATVATEHLVDLTAAYDLGEEFSLAGETWMLAAAYRYRRDENGERDHTVGLKLTIDLEGNIGGRAGASKD